MAAYAALGLAIASWGSRLPAIRNGLDLTPAMVGLVLFCLTAASFTAVTVSGLVVLRLGSARTARIAIGINGVGIVLVGLGTSVVTNVGVVACGLALVGLGNGFFNTSLNLEGAAVERMTGHFMASLHGSYSVGTVAGAALGAWAASLQVAAAWHLGLVAAVATMAVLTASRFFLADHGATGRVRRIRRPSRRRTRTTDSFDDPAMGPLPVITSSLAGGSAPRQNEGLVAKAWGEPHTLLLGLLLLGMALSEGAAGDWAALAVADGHGQSEAVGAAGFGVFVTFMTVGRFAGSFLLARFSRTAVLRGCAAVASVGLTLFVLAPALWLAFVGLGLWGLGTSLGFPVVTSAAADDPVRAAARVSVVTTIAYGAYLGGPPTLGLLAQHFGILHALLVILLLLATTFILAPTLRRQPNHGTK